jgi:asparagine synthase (glutamine-hydrolysing)
MVSSDGSIAIVFNGEIYNYRELAEDLRAKGVPCRTRSDTEVILNLYTLHGVECLGHLRGMFAFAIWDKAKRRLFAARDRVGIKPFYYLHSPRAFVFGSEIKAIAASGYSRLRLDQNAFSRLVRFLVVPQPDSIFDDIRKLEPGRFLLVGADGMITERVYWTPPVDGDAHDETDELATQELQKTLSDSVASHMVADVPVGAFLSGGVDSSLVVSLMREQAPEQEINAFSIGFPGLKEYDEDPYARQVAALKDIRYHTETINAKIVQDLPTIAWHLDEPFAISSAFATYYLARSAAARTKVVLTGDGGDELFAGYEGYKNDAYLGHAGSPAFYGAAFGAARAILGLYGNISSDKRRLLGGLRRRSGPEGLRYSEQVSLNGMRSVSLSLTGRAFGHFLRSWETNLMAYYYDELGDADRLRRKLHAEFKTRLVDEMLMKVDRMTMAHSLEARVPLLDHHVVERAYRTPTGLKLRTVNGQRVGKYVLKKCLESHLPRDIVYRRKQGFNIPVRHWLDSAMLALVRERAHDGLLRRAGIVDVAGLDRLIAEHTAGTHNATNMLLLLLSFEAWADAYTQRVGNISVH